MTDKTFRLLLRRQGFYIIVGILYDNPDGLTLKQLRAELTTKKTHYNNYLRVREYLLKIKLITYFLNKDNMKCVRLTEKGKLTWEKMIDMATEVEK